MFMVMQMKDVKHIQAEVETGILTGNVEEFIRWYVELVLLDTPADARTAGRRRCWRRAHAVDLANSV